MPFKQIGKVAFSVGPVVVISKMRNLMRRRSLSSALPCTLFVFFVCSIYYNDYYVYFLVRYMERYLVPMLASLTISVDSFCGSQKQPSIRFDV